MKDIFESPYQCPTCHALVEYEYECPDSGNDPTLVCVPPCGGAIEFTCPNGDWWYREPNNRSATGMGVQPEWLGQAMKQYFFQADYSDDEEEGEEE